MTASKDMRIFGVMGWPVQHSRSPAMHNAAFRHHDYHGVYVKFAVPPSNLRGAVQGIRSLGIAGVNVTLPHKHAIVELVDEVLEAARVIGAVNTLAWQDGRLIGENTDARGLVRALEHADFSPAKRNVVVVGAGGAARAAVVGLAHAGAARIHIAARAAEKARGLVADLRPHMAAAELSSGDLSAGIKRTLVSTDLLVQATSAPLAGGEEAARFAESLALDSLPRTAAVVDLVYEPRETAVLQRARARGLRVLDGLEMLVQQGAIAFELWTGLPAPVDVMRTALGTDLK